MVDFKELKQGDIINIKGIFGVSCIGVFNKVLNNIVILHCITFDDLNEYVSFETDDKKYCFFSIDAIKFCELASENEVKRLYTNIIKYYIEVVDKDWNKYFTDSTYYEVQDWFAYKCNVEFNEETFPIGTENGCETSVIGYPEFISDFTLFAWKYLCTSIGYDDEDNVTGDKLVSLNKVCEWLQNNMYCQPIFEYDEDQVPVNYVTASCCDSIEEFINKFKKSMTE
jgi:hypothetical protein